MLQTLKSDKMKKKLLLFILLSIMHTFASAQSPVHHVVQRGETIASIAKKFGISEENLKQANPDIKDFFYTGMKLIIPVNKEHKEEMPDVGKDNNSRKVAAESSYIGIQNHQKRNALSFGLLADVYGGFSTFQWDDGTPKNGVGFGAGFSGHVFWNGDCNPEGYLIEVGLGYVRKGSAAFPMDYISAKVLPLSYSFGENSLFLKGGMYIGVPLSKVKTLKNSYDGNFDYGLNLGIGYFISDKLSAMVSIENGLAKVCDADVELKNRVVFFTLSYRIK